MTSADLIQCLRKHNAFLCTAESCTGGFLANDLTDVSGASDVMWGGLITYDNTAKETLLNVSHSLILQHGAVSAEVARAMADGCVKTMSDSFRDKALDRRPHPSLLIGISLTGVAGPSGGTEAKPVGLCFIGLSVLDARGPETHRIFEVRNAPDLDRATQKKLFAEKAKQYLYEHLSLNHS